MVHHVDPAFAPMPPMRLATSQRSKLLALTALALVACSPGYSIQSSKTPELATLHELYIISDAGARGDGEATEFEAELGKGLKRCKVRVQISMTKLFESNHEVHLRAARHAGAKHLLTILHLGGVSSINSPASAQYEANLYDLGNDQVTWRARIDTVIYGADLAHAIYNRLAQDRVVPETCYAPVVSSGGRRRPLR